MKKITRRTLLGSAITASVTISNPGLSKEKSKLMSEHENSNSSNKPALKYQHVDVFTNQPLSGNGLNVFINDHVLDPDLMLRITQEMRQFEAVFLIPGNKSNKYKTSVFTTVEELNFAGHPLLGAAAALHSNLSKPKKEENWLLELREKTVPIISELLGPGYYKVTMDQGIPVFGVKLDKNQSVEILKALNLSENDWADHLPIQTVSTGLPHLIVPIKSGIEKAQIIIDNLEQTLSLYGAKFVYVVDVLNYEGRTWENSGYPEDIATASASGPTAAYFVRHGLEDADKEIVIKQGRFVNRPSQMRITLESQGEGLDLVKVSADVCLISRGIMEYY